MKLETNEVLVESRHPLSMHTVSYGQKIPVFRVTRPYLNLLVKPRKK